MDTRIRYSVGHYGGFSMHRLIRLILPLFLCGVIGSAHAAFQVPYSWRGIQTVRIGNATHLKGTEPGAWDAAGATVSGGKIMASGSANWYQGTGAMLQNGGVVFNAAIPLASTAAAVATTAVRANPAALVTSAVASYLLTKGIEMAADGSFTKQQPGQATSTLYPPQAGTPSCSNPSQGQICIRQWFGSQYQLIGGLSAAQRDQWVADGGQWLGNNGTWHTVVSKLFNSGYNPCSAGQSYSSGSCTGAPVKVPAQESDWDAVRVGLWPDPAMRDLVRNGVPLPTDAPTYSPASRDIPTSDPYTDPATNQRVRDMARVTPSPGMETAEVTPYRAPVDAAGNPTTNPDGTPVANQETDPCKLNPESSGCKPFDIPEDTQLQNRDINLSINPLPGFGPTTASCPADQTLFSKGGQPVTWSWGKFCDFSLGIRPLVIGFAWIAAIMIVVGVARREA